MNDLIERNKQAVFEKHQKMEDALENYRKLFLHDEYDISVSEFALMYKQDQIEFNKNFTQWDNVKKTKFIESVFLKLPIQKIFLLRTESGQYKIVDGNKRILTILEFISVIDSDFTNLISELFFLKDFEGINFNSLKEKIKFEFLLTRIKTVIILKDNNEVSNFICNRLNSEKFS
jgi:hypothetical protein